MLCGELKQITKTAKSSNDALSTQEIIELRERIINGRSNMGSEESLIGVF
jgi:hypothetical protein